MKIRLRLSVRLFSIVLLSLFLSFQTYAQVLPSGPQVLSFHSDVDDTEQPYSIYIPKNFNPKKKYPFVVMLHGAGSNHRLAMRRVFGKSNFQGENDVEASRYFPEWKDVDYIVAASYARGTAGYQGIMEKDVMDMVADVKKRFPIDEDRTYLTGLSMGGGGTLWVGLSYPDMWAAIAPVCPAPPDGTKEKLGNALNIPVHYFQGDKDPAVNVDSTRKLVAKMKELGNQVEYAEYPNVQHDSWNNAYKDEFIFSWFSKFKRNKYPDRVRYATSQYKHNKAYWVAIDDIETGAVAEIDAKFSATNKIDITTNKLLAFTLNLTGHPKFKANALMDVTINGKNFKISTPTSLGFHQEKGEWMVSSRVINGLAKTQGAEGPMSEVIASRHIYVYGTGGNPSKEDLEKRIEIARKAADWSTYRGDFLGRVMVFPRVVADKDVRPFDIESSNLILFGTKETNTMIAKYAEQLPLSWSGGEAETGLAYVFPVGKKYVLINSGLPWWEAAGTSNTGVVSRLSSPLTLNTLRKYGDYLIFNKTAVLAEGRFDNNWKLMGADAEKVKNSGVVTQK
jgi:poly(3-hydroxybutyrate) depolymerase